jgi:hypothetical protein
MQLQQLLITKKRRKDSNFYCEFFVWILREIEINPNPAQISGAWWLPCGTGSSIVTEPSCVLSSAADSGD